MPQWVSIIIKRRLKLQRGLSEALQGYVATVSQWDSIVGGLQKKSQKGGVAGLDVKSREGGRCVSQGYRTDLPQVIRSLIHITGDMIFGRAV